MSWIQFYLPDPVSPEVSSAPGFYYPPALMEPQNFRAGENIERRRQRQKNIAVGDN